MSSLPTSLPIPRHPRRLRSSALAFWAAVLMLASSCGNALVDKTELIADKTWKDQTITFEFDIADTSQRYDMILYLTHDADYAYQNFYTQLTVNFPPPTPPRVNALSMELSDKQGNWHGKCSGNSCTIPLAFMTKTKFQTAGKHSLSFQQHSRAQQVEGLEKLRLCIQPSPEASQ